MSRAASSHWGAAPRGKEHQTSVSPAVCFAGVYAAGLLLVVGLANGALEAAGVVKAEFRAGPVAAALGVCAERVDDARDALARRSLLRREDGCDRHAFTHALIEEVCVERARGAVRPSQC